MKAGTHTSIFRAWLPIGVGVTILAGLVYGAVQQSYRLGADDPQIQLAEDAARRLDSGVPAGSQAPGEPIEVDRSLAPFVIVYDAAGQPQASNGRLDGEAPVPPPSVFSDARQAGQRRFTWEPRDGVRLATVVQPYQNGFVLAGRSLREVEDRESSLMWMVFAAWLAALGLSAAAVALVRR